MEVGLKRVGKIAGSAGKREGEGALSAERFAEPVCESERWALSKNGIMETGSSTVILRGKRIPLAENIDRRTADFGGEAIAVAPVRRRVPITPVRVRAVRFFMTKPLAVYVELPSLSMASDRWGGRFRGNPKECRPERAIGYWDRIPSC
jgi:hypothetical protein